MKCPVCSSESSTKHIDVKDHFLTGELFQLHKCDGCGLLFTAKQPPQKDIEKYYESDDYISHNDKAGGIINLAYRIVRSFMFRRKRRLVKKSTGLKTGKILDIGSGTGHFLSFMTRTGWEAQGIEINPKAREFSSGEFGLKVNDPSNIKKIPDNYFDCVTLWHVLEHFDDPATYLKEIKRILKPGGVCVVALPNNESFDAIHYKEYWAAWDVPRHYWHFSPVTFSLFIDRNGFENIMTKYLPMDGIYISILSEKYKKTAFPLLAGASIGKWYWFKTLFNKEKSSSLVYFLRQKRK